MKTSPIRVVTFKKMFIDTIWLKKSDSFKNLKFIHEYGLNTVYLNEEIFLRILICMLTTNSSVERSIKNYSMSTVSHQRLNPFAILYYIMLPERIYGKNGFRRRYKIIL